MNTKICQPFPQITTTTQSCECLVINLTIDIIRINSFRIAKTQAIVQTCSLYMRKLILVGDNFTDESLVQIIKQVTNRSFLTFNVN